MVAFYNEQAPAKCHEKCCNSEYSIFPPSENNYAFIHAAHSIYAMRMTITIIMGLQVSRYQIAKGRGEEIKFPGCSKQND